MHFGAEFSMWDSVTYNQALTLRHRLVTVSVPPQQINFSTTCLNMHFKSVYYLWKLDQCPPTPTPTTTTHTHKSHWSEHSFIGKQNPFGNGNKKLAQSSRSSRFWKLRTPCLWPLGMRSWEDPQCLETNHLHQTSCSLHQHQQLFLGEKQNKLIVFAGIFYVFFGCCFFFYLDSQQTWTV